MKKWLWLILLSIFVFVLFFKVIPFLFVCDRLPSGRISIEYCESLVSGKTKREFFICDLYKSKDQRENEAANYFKSCKDLLEKYYDAQP